MPNIRTTPLDIDVDPRPLSELTTSGLLWLINSSLLHPRGFALALYQEVTGEITGWTIVGDGSEPFMFEGDSIDDDCFRAVSQLLSPKVCE